MTLPTPLRYPLGHELRITDENSMIEGKETHSPRPSTSDQAHTVVDATSTPRAADPSQSPYPPSMILSERPRVRRDRHRALVHREQESASRVTPISTHETWRRSQTYRDESGTPRSRCSATAIGGVGLRLLRTRGVCRMSSAACEPLRVSSHSRRDVRSDRLGT